MNTMFKNWNYDRSKMIGLRTGHEAVVTFHRGPSKRVKTPEEVTVKVFFDCGNYGINPGLHHRWSTRVKVLGCRVTQSWNMYQACYYEGPRYSYTEYLVSDGETTFLFSEGCMGHYYFEVEE